MSLLKELVGKLKESDDFQFGGGAMDASSPSGQDMGDVAVNTDNAQMDADAGAEDDTTQGNPEDAVSMDVPLLIRIMEWAKEDAESDVDLHKVVENLVAMSADGDTLTMENYDDALQGIGMTPDDEPGEEEDTGYGDNGSMDGMQSDNTDVTGDRDTSEFQ